jgi:hypothetical protein
MQGFDLADTLVHINYKSGNIVSAIAHADVLYRPKGNFIIITAQQDNASIHSAISSMVADNFPNCQRVIFVNGGEAEIIKKKAAAIKRLKLTDFTDNNRAILAGLKELNLGVKLWVMTQSGRKPY